MMAPKVMLLVAGFSAAAAIAVPCAAQPNDSNIFLNAPGLVIKKPKPGLPEVKPQPFAWPRLDAGATLCRSEADLLRLAERRRGGAVEGPVDRQVLSSATPITIVQRKGPGLTQVRTGDPMAGGAGWTDAYLPQKAPPGALR